MFDGKVKTFSIICKKTFIIPPRPPHILRYACMYGVIEIPFSKRLLLARLNETTVLLFHINCYRRRLAIDGFGGDGGGASGYCRYYAIR